MITVGLYDSTFTGCSMSYADETTGMNPVGIRWDRENPASHKIQAWTDLRLQEVVGRNATVKLAILIEPKCVSTTHYEAVINLADKFDVIFTHDKSLLMRGGKYAFYPFGGSRLINWGLKEKAHAISMIVGSKKSTEGHRLRHEIAEYVSTIDGIDLYGEPYTKYMKTKHEALDGYMYSIVIENCSYDYWFTEKLIDCMSQGTIPIYCGCQGIGEFFNMDGIISFGTADELYSILERIGSDYYYDHMVAVRDNLARARSYTVAESWIERGLRERNIY